MRKIPFHAVLVLLLAVGAILPSDAVCAVVKDTDTDGVSDQAEQSAYRTDVALYDTDGDGIGDGEEIVDGTDPLDPGSSKYAVLKVSDPGILGDREKFAWYFARATGILAFVLLSFVTAFGLIISSRAFMRRILPANALEFHRTLSWLALVSVVLHFGSFFFDDFLRMSILETFVPFLLERDFETSMGFDIGQSVALGIIAFYLVLMLILTSEFRAKMPSRVWRTLHYGSFVAYPLFVAHGFMAGTDSGESWMRVIYGVSVSVVSVLIVIRIIFRNVLPKIRARNAARSAVLPSDPGVSR